MNFKERFSALIESNPNLTGALAEIKASKPKLKDLLSSEKLQVFFRKLACFLVAVRDTYCKEKGITEDELVEMAAEYLDKKIELPWFIEPFDGIIFRIVLRNLMAALENMTEMQTELALIRTDLSVRCA